MEESNRSCPVQFTLADSRRLAGVGRTPQRWMGGCRNLAGHPFGCPVHCYFLPDFFGAGFLGACGLREGCFLAGTYPSSGTLPDEPVLGNEVRRLRTRGIISLLDLAA